MHNRDRLSSITGGMIFIVFFLLVTIVPAAAQTAPIAQRVQPLTWHSGVHDGDLNSTRIHTLVSSDIIEMDNVPWLRLNFSAAYLGKASHIVVSSLYDGHVQTLDARGLAEWGMTSAYFNGTAVKIELYAARGDKGIFLQMDRVTVGEWNGPPIIMSQCGPTDDRIRSTDPRVARIEPIGCTGWIVLNGKHITAGHCATGSAQVLEFNVPPSLPNGTVQHPGPEDQYPIIQSSFQSASGGIGNDWGVFDVSDNSNTGLQPIDAQGASFFLVQDYAPDSIRITGHGVDTGADNQVQQTHIGPNAGSSGNVMRYVTDTEGGNSGSPIIDEVTQYSVGVHTHGGCNVSGGNNNGTSTFHPQFWTAVDFQPFVPVVPTNAVAYSDYQTPNSMMLTWEDPTHLATGDTLLPGEITVLIHRDAVLIDSLAGGIMQYQDMGLNDGQEYSYLVTARFDSSGLESDPAMATWIAGGSPVPSAPQNFSVAGSETSVTISWTNPNANIDSTPMDDFAGINLYQNGALVATFARTAADTGSADSDTYAPATPGFYDWHITAFDDETPVHESDPTAPLGTPLALPIDDPFDVAGEPNPGIWINSDGDINDRADSPPSGPLSLNLNGQPNGEDIVDLKPIDLSGMGGTGMVLAFAYQPQGTGNEPEPEDSLRVYFRNDLGDWVMVWSMPGMANQPFTTETIDVESAPNGGGSYFHGQFQVRLRSTGGAGLFPNDDWFVDDLYLGIPTGIGELEKIPLTYEVSRNFPNPFNPSTTVEFRLPERGEVHMVIYNALGQQIRALIQQTMDAGYHQVSWDGLDDGGRKAASGIYLYRFEAGAFSSVQKMILLK